MQLQHGGMWTPYNSRGSCKLAVLRMGKQCPNSSTESVVMLEKSALMFLHLSDFCLSWMFNWKAFICSGCALSAEEFSFSYLVTDWFSVPVFLRFRCFLTLGLCWANGRRAFVLFRAPDVQGDVTSELHAHPFRHKDAVEVLNISHCELGALLLWDFLLSAGWISLCR